jgi:hypothetical protein
MSLADKVLAVNNDLPIRTNEPVHSGKVRCVYWLTEADSRRLIAENTTMLRPMRRWPLWLSATVFPPLNVSGAAKAA